MYQVVLQAEGILVPNLNTNTDASIASTVVIFC